MQLLLLLLLPHNSQGMDGCHLDGEWGSLYWRCGDVCTSEYAGTKLGTCTCGNSTFGWNEGKWCCGKNCTGGCLKWEEGHKDGDDPFRCAEWEPVICSTGVALNLNQSCQGSCNYYGGDESRNYLIRRSYAAACANTSTCVKEGEGITGARGYTYKPTICTGDYSCEGELDWCREEERKEEKCPEGFIRCPGIGNNAEGGNRSKSIPGQCIENSKVRDGKENNCLDRSDEDPFQEAANAANKETIINFAKLNSCTIKYGDSEYDYGSQPGLECGNSNSSNCIILSGWCIDNYSSECPVLGEGIRTSDPTLCANISFWRKLSCGEGYVRCQAGNSGQCVDGRRWGIEVGLRLKAIWRNIFLSKCTTQLCFGT